MKRAAQQWRGWELGREFVLLCAFFALMVLAGCDVPRAGLEPHEVRGLEMLREMGRTEVRCECCREP